MAVLLRIFYAFIFILLIWAAGFAVFVGSSLMLKPQAPQQNTDAIIVLTGGDGRIETGLRLFAEGRAPELFISGVHPSVTLANMSAVLKSDRILPACCITLGYQAVSTQQNAQETSAWAKEKGIRSLRLVTSNYHTHRAVLEFRAALPEVTILIQPVAQEGLTPQHRYFWIVMLSEYHKAVFRFVTLLCAKMVKP